MEWRSGPVKDSTSGRVYLMGAISAFETPTGFNTIELRIGDAAGGTGFHGKESDLKDSVQACVVIRESFLELGNAY